MMPSLFIAHGAPILAIEDNPYTRFLADLGRHLPRPRAIVVFSAHWASGIQKVSEVRQYDTIYDFGGFPDELYQIRYQANGDQEIAEEIEKLLGTSAVQFTAETKRGLDHGAWVVLRLLYPSADVPVIAMSVNPEMTPDEQYQIGKSLRSLREKDVLVIASGGTVHNLRTLRWQDDAVTPWALAFDEWLSQQIGKWDLDSLFHYDTLAPGANQAVPPYGSEHFIPIFYAMGAAHDSQRAELLHRSYRYGSLSQSVWQFG